MPDVTHLIGDLYIGSAPASGRGYEKFEVIAFCAEEYQPDAKDFPNHKLRHFPFGDATVMTGRDVEMVLAAGRTIARDLMLGRKTLVTCAMGRNRSALACALALHFVTGDPAAKCGKFVRAKRIDQTGVRALENERFRRFLEEL